MEIGDRCATCGHDRVAHGLFADQACFVSVCTCKHFRAERDVNALINRVIDEVNDTDTEPQWERVVEVERRDVRVDSPVGETESSGEIQADGGDGEMAGDADQIPDPADRNTMGDGFTLPF
jgi:hypothetical protein